MEVDEAVREALVKILGACFGMGFHGGNAESESVTANIVAASIPVHFQRSITAKGIVLATDLKNIERFKPWLGLITWNEGTEIKCLVDRV